MNSIKKYELMLKDALNQDFESYEDYENLENGDVENYRLLKRAVSKRFGRPKVSMRHPVMQRAGLTPASSSIAAQFDIKITRMSASIALNLPIIIFAPLHLLGASYSDILQIPSGVTGGVISKSDGSVEFQYQQVAGTVTNTDTITLSCLQVPLKTLYMGLMNAEFDIFKMRFTASAAKYQDFFAQPLGTYKKSLLGKISDVDTIPFVSQKSPSDYAQNILDVDVNLHLQNDKALTYSVPAAADTLTISFFVNNLIIK